MLAFVARRLLALIPLLFVVTLVVFSLVLLLPGDAASVLIGDQSANPADVERIREELGTNRPFVAQFADWVGGVVQGDFGNSLFRPDRSVGEEIRDKFPVTLSVALGAIVYAAIAGGIIGTIAGLRPGGVLDRLLAVFTSLAIGIPSYVLALLLVIVFAVELDLLPSIGYVPLTENPYEWFIHLIMPWIALGVPASAGVARQVRGAIVDVMREDYIRTARAKGLRRFVVVYKHAMKNASLPAITVIGIQFAYLLGGTVIIERIFSIDGIGRMISQAIATRDIPVIQGVAFLMAVIFLLVNLVVDIAYALVNPKVRLS